MTPAIQALLAEIPDKTERIAQLAKEKPRFVKLTNTWHALGREVQRFEGDRARAQDAAHLRKMHRIVRNKIDLFLM